MTFMLMIGAVLFKPAAMTIFLVIFLAAAIADLFKRHLLSNAVVYTASMLIIPAAALSAVGAPIYAILENVTIGREILLIAESFALIAVCMTLYIRGHVSPIDKTLEKYSGGIKFYAAKRLISVGIAGNCLYGVLLIESIAEVTYLAVLGGLSISQIPIYDLPFLPVILIALLITPIFNVIFIFILIIIGAEFVWLGATAMMTLIPVLLIANGCIRYILTTDMTKGKKALWIFLSLIPAFNLVYGIKCLTKINKRLKETQFS
ncbi:MAG: hypothetical protein K2K34_00100 [Oscillospiraceae bacterium]|nr:hypothetical protein [Oscillospiraceae bacterium]